MSVKSLEVLMRSIEAAISEYAKEEAARAAEARKTAERTQTRKVDVQQA